MRRPNAIRPEWDMNETHGQGLWFLPERDATDFLRRSTDVPAIQGGRPGNGLRGSVVLPVPPADLPR